MSCSATVNSIVCQEVFDDNSQPSEEEIREYAIRIGIDPDTEQHLLPIARDGVMKALPPNWVPVFDKELNLYYYFNQETNKASWEHPLDGEIRDFVRKCKLESNSSTADDDSKTSLREELKSYEEVASASSVADIRSRNDPSDMQSWNQTGNYPALAGNRRPGTASTPTLLSRRSLSFDKNLSEADNLKSKPSTSFIGRFAVDRVPKIDIDRQLQRLEQDDDEEGAPMTPASAAERPQRVTGRSKLTLTGGGSVFLKSNQHKQSTDVSSPTKSAETKPTDLTAVTPGRSPGIDEPRGILRAPSADRLWDRNLQEMSSTERSLWRQQELEDDRKYVRFSLEKGLDLSFKLSEEDDDDEDDDDDDEDDDLEEEEDDDDLLDAMTKERRWGADSGSSDKSDPDSKDSKDIVETKPQSNAENKILEKNSTRFPNERSETQKLIDGLLGVPLSVELKAASGRNDTEKSGFSGIADLPPPSMLKSDEATFQFGSDPKSSHIESILERSQRALKADSLSSIKRPSPVDERLGRNLENLWNKEKSFPFKAEPVRPTSAVVGAREASDRINDGSSSAGKQNESKKATTVIDLRTETTANDTSQQRDSDGKNDSPSSSTSSNEKKTGKSDDDSEKAKEKKKSETPEETKQTSDEGQGDGLAETKKVGRAENTKEDSSPGESRRQEKGPSDREKALREWNVMSDQPYRPPLSRQSSQQQLIRKPEPEQTSEREKALRDWNVTGAIHQLEAHLEDKGASEDKTAAKEKENKSETPSTSTDITDRLSIYAKLEKEHSERLAREEAEHRKRLEEMEKEHKARLKTFEEDHRAALEKADAENLEKQQQRQKSWRETLDQEEQEWRVRLQLSKEEQKRMISDMQHEHHKAMAALETENQADIMRLREKHTADLQNLREQFHKEEEALRKEHAERIENAAHRSSDTQDNARMLERLRCEKHLLEDKYHILKEKYVNLKKEVNSAIQRREQRREQRKTETDASTSVSHTHTDKSSSTKRQHQRGQQPHPQQPPRQGQQPQQQPQQQQGQQQQGQQQQEQGQQQQQQQQQGQENQQQEQQQRQQQQQGQGKQQQQRPQDQQTDDSSFSHLDSDNNNTQQTKKGRSGNVAAQVMRWNTNHSGEDKGKGDTTKNARPEPAEPVGPDGPDNTGTPMDALHRQLRTLDELEEQFPVTALADTYLPYPFPEDDRELGSAELEFFRHRIHLEQDLVRQARNLLRAQHNVYLTRLHNLKQMQTNCEKKVDSGAPVSTLNQMAQEEQELSQMEASLQRTRALLCEKIIRLRRLENSLRHVSDTTKPTEKSGRWASKRGDKKYAWEQDANVNNAFEDNSSDSGGSSGVSSTEFPPNVPINKIFNKDDDLRRTAGDPFFFSDDSNDINASLHNLNAEISEIWSVLCRQRAAAGLGPPPLLSSRPPTSNVWLPSKTIAIAQPNFQNDVGLVERARNLRRWLQQAKMSAAIPPNDVSMKPQMSL